MINKQIHKFINQLPRYEYSGEMIKNCYSVNGLYFVFEEGETFDNYERIVRVGSHRGEGNLINRVNEHFTKEDKDRSIFRKHIGRSILNARQDPYLAVWDIDFTTKAKREKFGHLVKHDYQKSVENEVSQYMRNKMSYTLLPLASVVDSLFWEKKLIALLAKSREIVKPSKDWLGNYSTKDKIRMSGLWLIQHLNGPTMTFNEWEELQKLANR